LQTQPQHGGGQATAERGLAQQAAGDRLQDDDRVHCVEERGGADVQRAGEQPAVQDGRERAETGTVHGRCLVEGRDAECSAGKAIAFVPIGHDRASPAARIGTRISLVDRARCEVRRSRRDGMTSCTGLSPPGTHKLSWTPCGRRPCGCLRSCRCWHASPACPRHRCTQPRRRRRCATASSPLPRR